MGATFSLSQSGSTPNYNPSNGYGAKSPGVLPPQPTAVPKMSYASPSTPIKSIAYAHPDGTNVTQTFHAPEKTNTTPVPSMSPVFNQSQKPPSLGTNPGMINKPLAPITSIVPGTQNKSPTAVAPWSGLQTRVAAQGVQTQAANHNTEGSDAGLNYFTNLAKNGNPSEQQAANIWLKNHPQGFPSSQPDVTSGVSGTLTQGPSGSGATASSGLVPNDITKPIDSANINNGNPVPTTPNGPYVPENPRLNGVNQGGLIGNLVGMSQNSSPEYTNAYNIAQDYAKQLADLKKQEAETYKNVEGTAGFMPQATGIEGVANRYFAGKEAGINAGYQGASNLISGANAQQGLKQGALGTALGYNAPVYGLDYGKQVGNPSAPGGGYDSSLTNVGQGQNVQTIQTNTTKINDIDSQSTAVDNNFSRAVNYAKNANIPNGSAILAGLISHLQGTVGGDASIAGFKQVIDQLNQQAQTLGFGAVDPNTVTPAQLTQIQQAVKQKLANDRANLQSENDKLKNSGSSSSSGSSTGGGLFGW